MKGKILLFIFALPFFGVGVWMGASIGSTLLDARAMQSWVAVEATLNTAGLETHTGDDSNTYEAYARYTYAFGGRRYTGDRVAIAGGADNIGSYQQDLGRRLDAAMRRGDTVAVYVNPDAPAEAVIDRSIRWSLLGFKSIFLFVFGGAGLGLIIWVFRSPKAKDLSAPEFVDKPWLANEDWQTGIVRSGSRAYMWFTWGFAAFWNLISAPLPFVLYEEVVNKGNTIALVGLIFPVVGVGLLWWAISRTLEWRRFGPAPVALDPFPGSIGGHVGGTIDINLPYDPGARFSVTLTSLHSFVSGSGKDRSRRESPKWQDVQVAHAMPGARGTRVSFRFDVPDDQHESDVDRSEDSYYLWRLNLQARLPGTDIDRDYEIPVYATAETSQNLANFAVDAAKAAQRKIDLDIIGDLVRLQQGVQGKSMLYPAGRHVASSVAGLLFGGIFSAIGWFLAVHEEHGVMGGVFGFVGLLILLVSFYRVTNSLELVQAGATIRTVRRVLGIPVKTREMRLADFVRFDTGSSMSTQAGSKHVMYYSLYAIQRGGQKLIVGEGFAGAGQASAAAEFIAREFGLAARLDTRKEAHGFAEANLLTAD
jgi:hypothetical protein